MLRSFIVLCAWLLQICSKQRHPRPHSFDIHQFPICCKGWCPISDVGRVRFNRVIRPNSRQFSQALVSARSAAGTATGTGLAVLIPGPLKRWRTGCAVSSPSSRLLAPCRSACARKPIARRPERNRTISRLIPTGIPMWCSSSQRRRLIPTSMPNAAMILNPARIGTGKLHNQPLISHDALRVGRSAFPQLELSHAQHRVQLREPEKRRVDRQHLGPANN